MQSWRVWISTSSPFGALIFFPFVLTGYATMLLVFSVLWGRKNLTHETGIGEL